MRTKYKRELSVRSMNQREKVREGREGELETKRSQEKTCAREKMMEKKQRERQEM